MILVGYAGDVNSGASLVGGGYRVSAIHALNGEDVVADLMEYSIARIAVAMANTESATDAVRIRIVLFLLLAALESVAHMKWKIFGSNSLLSGGEGYPGNRLRCHVLSHTMKATSMPLTYVQTEYLTEFLL